MNGRRLGWLLATFLIACSVSVPVSAQGFVYRMRAQEQAVKQMPIEQRPNRFGHFYGNNVRRMQSGRFVINSPQPGMSGFGSAARRYFYLP